MGTTLGDTSNLRAGSRPRQHSLPPPDCGSPSATDLPTGPVVVSLFGFLLLAAYALRRVLGRWGVWVLAPLGGSSGALAKEAREVG